MRKKYSKKEPQRFDSSKCPGLIRGTQLSVEEGEGKEGMREINSTVNVVF